MEFKSKFQIVGRIKLPLYMKTCTPGKIKYPVIQIVKGEDIIIQLEIYGNTPTRTQFQGA